MKLYLWKNASEKTLLDCDIKPDDTISLVLKKVAYSLDVPWTNLYCWTKYKLSPVKVTAMIKTILFNVFRGRKTIKYIELAEVCQHLFNIDIQDSQYNNIDLREAQQVLAKKLKDVKNTKEPIGFKYVYDGHIQYINYNPFKTSTKNNVATYVNNELGLVIPNVSVLNFVVYSPDYPTELFPFRSNKEKEIVDATKKLIKSVKEVDNVIDQTDISEFDGSGFVSFVHIHADNNSQIILEKIFDMLHTSEIMSFIKIKQRTNAFFKIHESYVETLTSDKDTFKKLTMVSSSNSHSEYVLLRFQFTPLSAATVILKETGSYDVKMNFSVHSKETPTSISKYFAEINKIIDLIIRSSRVLLPTIPNDVFTERYDDISLEKLVYYGIINNDKSQFNFKNFAAVVKSKLYPYFDVIDLKDANILHLQYKKVDNYTQFDNIKAYITQHYHLEKEDLISKVAVNFSITEDEASKQVDAWNLTNEVQLVKKQNKTYFKPKNDTFVSLKIRLNSTNEMRYFLTGAKNWQMIQRIQHLLSVLSKLSMSSIKSSKGKTLPDMIDIVPDRTKLTFADVQDQKDDDNLSSMLDSDSDDDYDLLALEAEFANQESEQTEEIQIEEDKPIKKKGKGELLMRLREADDTLFNYKVPKTAKRTDYASVCGVVSERQPVVVSKSEYEEINKKYPGAVHGYVKTGSNPTLASKNYYICPNIWCPKSRLAITYEAYKKAGFKCPNPDIEEDPYLFVRAVDKTLEESELSKKLSKPHYPSFLDMYTHPDKLCLPCCFLTSPEAGNRNQKRKEACISNHLSANAAKPASAEKTDNIMGNEKYIKAETYCPLEVARYGLLSKDIQDLFGKFCGSRHDGTGLMKDKTTCFLRRGIDHGTQSFLACIEYILQIQDIRRIILNNLSIEKYVSLENGRLLKLFLGEETTTQMKEFKKWFFDPKQDGYVARFNLTKLRDEIKENDEISEKEIIREYLIWLSYNHFFEYLRNDTHSKDHRVLIDLINMGESWLNPQKVVFIVIDVDPVSGKSFVQCPTRPFTTIDKVAFVIKRGIYYEPFVKVVNKNKKNVEEQLIFDWDRDFPELKPLLNIYIKQCKAKDDAFNRKNCKAYLESQNYEIRSMVVDYSFMVCGIILKNNLYIPLFNKEHIFDHKKSRFVYFNEVPRHKCRLEQKEVKEIYKLVRKYMGDDRYKITSFDDEIGFYLANGDFIPLNIKKATLRIKNSFVDDLNIFVGHDSDVTDKLISKLGELMKENEDLQQEIAFLLDRGNPIPKPFRINKLQNILSKFSLKVDDSLMQQMTQKIIAKLLPGVTSRGRFTTEKEEYLLTYREIKMGKLAEISELRKDPFKYIHDHLNNHEEIAYEDVIDDKSPIINNIPGLDFEYEDLPTKFRKILPGFMVARAVTYDRNWLKNVFWYVVSGGRIDDVVLDASLQKAIMKDFNENKELLQSFEANPCYQSLWKKTNNYGMLDSYLDSIKQLSYYPSLYELRTFAKVVGVNILISGRVSKSGPNPDGIEVILNDDIKTGKYIIFRHDYNRFQKHDEFAIFAKNKKQMVFKAKELPEEFMKIIREKSKGVFEVAVLVD